MNSNKSLFYYGLKAKIKGFFGVCFIFFGFIFSFGVGFFNQTLGLILFLFSFVVGIYLIITAKAQRFDYQRQSGNIIHRGDWD